MRLEITIPDSTLPAVKSKLSALLDQLSACPELVEEIHLRSDDATTSITLTAEQIDIIRQGQADIKAGKGIPLEQARALCNF